MDTEIKSLKEYDTCYLENLTKGARHLPSNLYQNQTRWKKLTGSTQAQVADI